MLRDAFKTFKKLFPIVIIITILLTLAPKLNPNKNPEIAKKSMNIREKVENYGNIGNPEEYDKDQSILRYTPLVFVVGGIFFLGQRLIREKSGHDYDEYYRTFWKEEPFGGFHPEIEDDLGRVVGSDRNDSRGMLGYRSYGKDNEEQQKDLNFKKEAYDAGYDPYGNQQQQQNNQYNQQQQYDQQQSQGGQPYEPAFMQARHGKYPDQQYQGQQGQQYQGQQGQQYQGQQGQYIPQMYQDNSQPEQNYSQENDNYTNQGPNDKFRKSIF